MSRPWLVLCHCFKQCRQKLCKHGSCFGSVNMSEHTEQDTSSRRLCSNVLIFMSSLETSKRSKIFREIQFETMKSCDFCLALLRILAVYYDNPFHCTNQSGPFIYFIWLYLIFYRSFVYRKHFRLRFLSGNALRNFELNP